MVKEYEHYIFDFDFTLFDTSAALTKCYASAFSAIGIKPNISAEELAKESFELTRQRFNMSLSQFETFVDTFEETSKACVAKGAVPFPETEFVLYSLHNAGKRLSIVTCKPKADVEAILNTSSINVEIDDIVGDGDYVRPKPWAEPILVALNRSDIDPQMSVYIGDSPNDKKSAEAAGIDGYLINRCARRSKWRIKDLQDLLLPIEHAKRIAPNT